jgi:VWFA-related protein
MRLFPGIFTPARWSLTVLGAALLGSFWAEHLTLAQTQVAAPAAQAGASTASTTPPALFRSTAALVLIDVTVTNGVEPIHGLPRGQFHLFEDGKEQKLIALEERRAVDPSTVQPPPALPPHIYSNIPETPVSGTVNVLLLDALNTPIASQATVRQQMIAYLKTIPPGTRLGIFTLASRLRMVQGITSDSRPLQAALNGKSGPGKSALPTQSVLLADPTDTSMTDIGDTLAQMGATTTAAASIQQFQADQAAFQTDLRVRYTLDALEQLARYLRNIPGRKNLIWFSGSFPLTLDPDATLQSPFEAMRVYAPDVRQTTAMLSASRVAVYPIDARGLFNDPQYSVETSGSGMNGVARGQPRFAQSSGKFFQQTAAEHATMQQIAEQTGGRAVFNTNGLKEAVAQAVQNGSSYYTVAYIPENKSDDGRLHKIKITLPETPSYKLTYRTGYVAESAKKQAANPTPAIISAAMLHGAPPYSEIVYKLRVLSASDPALKGIALQPGPAGEPSPKVKGPLVRYSIDYAADLHGVTLSDTPDGMHHASLEFVAAAYDRDGARLNSVDRAYTVNMPEDRLTLLMTKGLQIHQEIDLPAGEVYLRTAIHDLSSDRVGAVEIPLLVKPVDGR